MKTLKKKSFIREYNKSHTKQDPTFTSRFRRFSHKGLTVLRDFDVVVLKYTGYQPGLLSNSSESLKIFGYLSW